MVAAVEQHVLWPGVLFGAQFVAMLFAVQAWGLFTHTHWTFRMHLPFGAGKVLSYEVSHALERMLSSLCCR